MRRSLWIARARHVPCPAAGVARGWGRGGKLRPVWRRGGGGTGRAPAGREDIHVDQRGVVDEGRRAGGGRQAIGGEERLLEVQDAGAVDRVGAVVDLRRPQAVPALDVEQVALDQEV